METSTVSVENYPDLQQQSCWMLNVFTQLICMNKIMNNFFFFMEISRENSTCLGAGGKKKEKQRKEGNKSLLMLACLNLVSDKSFSL